LFFHFESVTGSNQKAAHAVAAKLHQAWAMTQVQQHAHPAQVQECASPQQRNGYDCGLHLLKNAQELADCSDTELVGIDSGINTTVTALKEMFEQRLTNRSLLFAEDLRAEIAQDIRLRAASAL
jgi:Ulp1 family protease